MFSYKSCQPVLVRGGREALGWRQEWLGGGLVEVEGRAVWGGPGGVYVLDGAKWTQVADGVRQGATLAVCGGELVYVGGSSKVGRGGIRAVMVWRGGRWISMPTLLKRCLDSCALGINGGGLVVMGGISGTDVQVFDGKTWHFGPPLPEGCWSLSAVVYGDQVFVMGGGGMKRAVWSANITDLVSH